MKKEFIPYTEALALKELGFDEPCFGIYYTKDGDIRRIDMEEAGNAPLYQQVFRWFRDKYVLDSIIQPTYSTKYQYRMFHIKGKTKVQIWGEYMSKEFKTYEEAEFACLKKLIEIVKTK
jgi:hypothetical protein